MSILSRIFPYKPWSRNIPTKTESHPSTAFDTRSGPRGVDLAPDLLENYDYVLVPAAAYARLQQWHGGDSGSNSPHFARGVVAVGNRLQVSVGNKSGRQKAVCDLVNAEQVIYKVEVYPFVLGVRRADARTGQPEEKVKTIFVLILSLILERFCFSGPVQVVVAQSSRNACRRCRTIFGCIACTCAASSTRPCRTHTHSSLALWCGLYRLCNAMN